jgi:hypothetical protein
MDEQIQSQVAEFYRRAIAEGASEEQALRLSRRFLAELSGGPSIGPAGPTAQPAFPTLPPMVGGALDMLIQFGLQGATFGTAGRLIPAVGAASAEIDARNPRMSMAMKGAGSAMSLPLTMAGATVAGAGAGLAGRLLSNRLVLGAAGGGATAAYLMNKLSGGAR